VSNKKVNLKLNLTGVWLLAFLVLKLGGSSMAAWSWWWLLLPIVPVLVVVFQRLGVM
jgi:hypothetical protein